MNPRLLVNLGLLAVAVALGWFAFKVDKPAPAPPGIALTDLAADRIETIQIERDGDTVARLRREGDVWRLLAPIDATADAFRVQTLLGLAGARSHAGFRAAGNDLTQYGLQPPRATVRFDATLLLIGGTDPVAGHRYVQNDDQVHVLEDNWFAQIFGNGAAWLDPRPLPVGATPLRIEFHEETGDAARPPVQWRQRDGHWQRTPADGSTGERTAAQRGATLAAAWQAARALAVQARDPALAWRARVIITFKPQSRSATTAGHTLARRTRGAAGAGTADPPGTASETISFSVARTTNALFLARDDLGVQYRFLARQGDALVDNIATP